MNKISLKVIILCISFVSFILISCFVYVFGGAGLSTSMENWGYFGSFISGIFSLLSISLLSYTLLKSQESSERQITMTNDDMRFNKFLILVNILRDSIDDVSSWSYLTLGTNNVLSTHTPEEFYQKIDDDNFLAAREIIKKSIDSGEVDHFAIRKKLYVFYGEHIVRRYHSISKDRFYSVFPVLLDILNNCNKDDKSIFSAILHSRIELREIFVLICIYCYESKDEGLLLINNIRDQEHLPFLVDWKNYIKDYC